MPYKVSDKGGGTCGTSQYAVLNSDTGATVACHPTRAKALAHMQALYANVPEARSAATAASIVSAMPTLRVRERPRSRPASMRMFTPVEVQGPSVGRHTAALDPPLEWFTDEAADEAPPKLTVFDGGRIAGVVAPEGVCILNEQRPGECWVVPRPADGRGSSLLVDLDGGWEEEYRMAHVGSLVTAEGVEIASAVLAGAGGHASPAASNGYASRHYNHESNAMDDTRWQVARGRYVWSDRAGGVVFLGACWPEVSDRQVAEIRAAACSIDYRWVTGRGVDDYRLLGATLVNIGALPTKYEHQIRTAGIATVTAEEVAAVVASARQPAIVASALGVAMPSSFNRAPQAPCRDCGGNRTAAYVVEDDNGPDYGDEVVWGQGLYGMIDSTSVMADGTQAFIVRPIIDSIAQDDTVVVPATGATLTGRSYTWECDDMMDSDDAVLSPPPDEAVSGGGAATSPPPVAAAAREQVRLAAAPPGAPATPPGGAAPSTSTTAPAADTQALESRVATLEATVQSLQTAVDDLQQARLDAAKSKAAEPITV